MAATDELIGGGEAKRQRGLVRRSAGPSERKETGHTAMCGRLEQMVHSTGLPHFCTLTPCAHVLSSTGADKATPALSRQCAAFAIFRQETSCPSIWCGIYFLEKTSRSWHSMPHLGFREMLTRPSLRCGIRFPEKNSHIKHWMRHFFKFQRKPDKSKHTYSMRHSLTSQEKRSRPRIRTEWRIGGVDDELTREVSAKERR